jgi:hypothetical protein
VCGNGWEGWLGRVAGGNGWGGVAGRSGWGNGWGERLGGVAGGKRGGQAAGIRADGGVFGGRLYLIYIYIYIYMFIYLYIYIYIYIYLKDNVVRQTQGPSSCNVLGSHADVASKVEVNECTDDMASQLKAACADGSIEEDVQRFIMKDESYARP